MWMYLKDTDEHLNYQKVFEYNFQVTFIEGLPYVCQAVGLMVSFKSHSTSLKGFYPHSHYSHGEKAAHGT